MHTVQEIVVIQLSHLHVQLVVLAVIIPRSVIIMQHKQRNMATLIVTQKLIDGSIQGKAVEERTSTNFLVVYIYRIICK